MEDKLKKLIAEIKRADYKDCDTEYMARRAEERVNELRQWGVKCVDRFIQKLIDRVMDKETYLDILMEGRFAIILARNGFSDIEIEYTKQGPDLKAKWSRKTIYFEITRRHSEIDEWNKYQAGTDEPEVIISRIQNKMKQLNHNEINIVVIWSDTVKLLKHNVEEAVGYIKQEIDNDQMKYSDLSGILYTEGGGVDMATFKQFYLFKNEKALKPIGVRLTTKLEALRERSLIQLKRENKRLSDAIVRLRLKQCDDYKN